MTINKYSSRHLSVISRDTSMTEEPIAKPSWWDDFTKHLTNNAAKSQRSIYDEISSILGNSKSKFSSVEEAVQDLSQRTGLATFLAQQKTASINEPKIFQEIPEMKIFIDNYITDHPGTSVEAVVHDLTKLNNVRDHLPDRSDVDLETRTYINDKIAELKALHPDMNDLNMNLGKVEHDSKVEEPGPLDICEPVAK